MKFSIFAVISSPFIAEINKKYKKVLSKCPCCLYVNLYNYHLFY